MRTSGLHSLDVGDFDVDERTLSVVHRPDERTRLKNCEGGERIVTLDVETEAVAADCVDYQRVDVEDNHGCRPLFSSRYGRMSK